MRHDISSMPPHSPPHIHKTKHGDTFLTRPVREQHHTTNKQMRQSVNVFLPHAATSFTVNHLEFYWLWKTKASINHRDQFHPFNAPCTAIFIWQT